MAIIQVPRQYPMPIQTSRGVLNGSKPNHIHPSAVADALNHVAIHNRKQVFCYAVIDDGSVVLPAAGTVIHRWAFHTGEASDANYSLRVKLIVTSLGGNYTFTVNDGSTTSTVDFDVVFGSVFSGTETVEDIGVGAAFLSVEPNTSYTATLEYTSGGGGTYPLSVCCFEQAIGAMDTADAITADSRRFFARAPIHGDAIDNLVDSAHDLWKHNGAHLFSASLTASRTTASYANAYDSTTTSVSADSPGFTLQPQYLNPYHTDNVECVFKVYASGTGDVRLVDSSGALGTLSFSGSAGEWKSGTVNLDGSAASQKVDIHFQGDGSNSITVNAVCLYTYVT